MKNKRNKKVITLSHKERICKLQDVQAYIPKDKVEMQILGPYLELIPSGLKIMCYPSTGRFALIDDSKCVRQHVAYAGDAFTMYEKLKKKGLA